MPRNPSTITTLSHEPVIAIRRAQGRDARAIERLAALDSSRPPRGTVLVAEVDGEPWAAMGIDDGHVVADPFRRSAGIVELLHARARQSDGLRRGRPILAPRWAA